MQRTQKECATNHTQQATETIQNNKSIISQMGMIGNKSIEIDMIDNENDLFNKNRVLICDTEILQDYFSFQFKVLDKDTKELQHPNIKVVDNVYIYECFNDNDCISFKNFYVNQIMRANTYLYFYNKSYDIAIINTLLNLAEKKTTDILTKVRNVSDYIIVHKVNYERVYKTYWHIFYEKTINDKENAFKKEMDNFEPAIKFVKEYKNYLANRYEKKVLKGDKKSTQIITVLDIPTSNPGKLCSGKDNKKGKKKGKKKDIPIGLKTLQIVLFNHKVKFDFNTYKTIESVKENNLYNEWLTYGANDVISAEKIFNKYVRPDIVSRFYALKTVNKVVYLNNADLFFTETNTPIINALFKIDNKQDVNFKYSDYIKCQNQDFNKFLAWIDSHDNVESVKLENYKGNRTINLNGCVCEMNLGGIHGALKNYTHTENNIVDIDFASLYPNIICNNADLFINVMNVELYENVKNMRLQYKALSKSENITPEQQSEYEKIQKGLKLLLNSTYGLINMPGNNKDNITYKKLGLFICLFGQATTINMLLDNLDCKPLNINTDGVYFAISDSENNIDKKVKEISNKAHIDADYKRYKYMLQNSVNDYIAIENNGELKLKGFYNITLKKKINTCSTQITNNIENAIKLMEYKQIEIEPIFFKKMKDLKDSAYYFTTEKHGIPLVKNLKQPKEILIDNKTVYVTDNIDNADIELYKKYAETTLNDMYNFDISIKSNDYYEYDLIDDTESNNKLKKDNVNRLKKLLQISVNQVGYSGFKGNVKSNTYVNNNPIKILTGYKKTKILNSIDTMSLNVSALDKLIIIDVDIVNKATNKPKSNIDMELIEQLKSIVSFKVWNSETQKYNFKVILKNDTNKLFMIKQEYKNYIEILDNAIVWSLENPIRTYFDNNTYVENASCYSDILDKLLNVKIKNAESYIATKENNDNLDSGDYEQQIKVLVELLKYHNVEVHNVDNKNIATSCPYCTRYNKEHYLNNKNKIDAYVNVNKIKSGKGYKLNIHCLSNSCQNDKNHNEFFEWLNNEFTSKLPTLKELEIAELINEFKENIDIKKIENLNKELLLANILRIVGTGGGKTFACALKLIENLILKDIFHIHSTKENKHIEDFQREVKKILKMTLKDNFDSDLIREFLQNDKKGLKEIGIHTLTTTNPIKDVSGIRGVVTNHTYFYKNGDTSQNNKNMSTLINYILENNIKEETVVDEYESFKTKGMIIITMNGHMHFRFDYDDKSRKVFTIAENCLYVAYKNIVNSNITLQNQCAIEFFNQELVEQNGIYKYKLDLSGGKNLKEITNRCLISYSIQNYDNARRKPKAISKENYDYCYLVVDKVVQYRCKELSESEKENMDFIKLISDSKTIAIVKKVLRVGKINKVNGEVTEILDIVRWGKEITNVEELMEYGKELETNSISFKKFKDILSLECKKELFVEKIIVYNNSTLDMLKGTKYYLTANPPRFCDLPINTELAHKSCDNVETIDIINIQCLKDGDKKILKIVEMLKGKPYQALAFLSLKRKINEIIADGYDMEHCIIKTTIPDDNEMTKTVGIETTNNEDINQSLKKNVTLAYANGTESQGRSYGEARLLITNSVLHMGIESRIEFDNDGYVYLVSIDVATGEKLKQIIGRIFRGKHGYKAIIIFGDYDFIKQVIDSYPPNFDIKLNLVNYNKELQRESDYIQAFEDILKYVEYKMGYGEKVEHFNFDKRKTGNNTGKIKYDELEIYNYYLNRVEEHKRLTNKKLKISEILPELKSKFGISKASFDRLKSKYTQDK